MHDLGQTYVHLDSSRHRVVVLSAAAPRMLHLRKASMIVDRGRLAGQDLDLDFGGFGWAVFQIAGGREGEAYGVTLEDSQGRTIRQASVTADASGVVRFSHLLDAPQGTYRLRVARQRGPDESRTRKGLPGRLVDRGDI